MSEEVSRRDKIKQHLKENKKFYLGLGSGVGIAGISWFIMRGVASHRISRGIPVTAERGIPVLADRSDAINNVVSGKNNVLNSVSYFSANRQGPPSWVVRCLETGIVFTSQNAASMEMDLPRNEISRHLNGALESVRGYHFERICMAA